MALGTSPFAMPELPDLTVYLEALSRRLQGKCLEGIRLGSPFLLRSVTPTIAEVSGRRVERLERIGKRLVMRLAGDHALVLHLMVAGRLKWEVPHAALPRKIGLAVFDFDAGALVLTEAGSKKRAALHLTQGEAALRAFDRGGLELFEITAADFARQLAAHNHTLKRFLTDPRLISGVGNSYSDEILHRARLSPMTLSTRLTAHEAEQLFIACRQVLTEWTERLRADVGDGFPTKVTAFRDGMSVHGRYGKPCPVCATPVQRIRYADNETNYCPTCQTAGRLLADRSLSRLLKDDWPKTLVELEELKAS